MGEKRRSKRYSKRIKVEFGEKDFSVAGFTHDISKSGAFIVSASRQPAPGSIIHIKLVSAEGRWFACEAEVRWLKEVPQALRTVQRAGFGVRFLFPDELVVALLPQLKAEKRFEILYETRKDLDEALRRELRMGGVFIRTDLRLPVDSEVTLEVRLEFAKETLDVAARVMQQMAPDPDRGIQGGLAFAFVDKAGTLKSLEEARG